jgi:acetyl-CoA carboxylase biotin carboxyl carrier protein
VKGENVTFSYKDIAEIIKVIDASNLDELVIELPEIRLVIRRRGTGSGASASSLSPLPAPAATPLVPSAPSKPASAPAASPPRAAARASGMIEVRSPMVGTFYRAPSPKDPPFVEVGTVVKPGQALCLIEVMKLYTTIEAKQAGKVVEILAANTALVEYDQVLFVIEPQ